MQLILTFGETGPVLTVQSGERLTRVCATCGGIWLNDTMIAGYPQCQHREIGVLPIWKAPEITGPVADLPVDMQDPNQVLSAVINKFAQALEAANLPPEELAEGVAMLQAIHKQLEVPHA